MKLDREYFLTTEAVPAARDLIGKFIVTEIDGAYCSAMITETEAYNGVKDRGSHSFGGKKTRRNSVMYFQGGYVYVYLCYGLHHLFNIVISVKDDPKAVLIRSVQPFEGIFEMKRRRGLNRTEYKLTSGPGSLSKALGITTGLNGTEINTGRVIIEDRGVKLSPDDIVSSPRIGIDYAGKDSLLPYRFILSKSKWLSRP